MLLKPSQRSQHRPRPEMMMPKLENELPPTPSGPKQIESGKPRSTWRLFLRLERGSVDRIRILESREIL